MSHLNRLAFAMVAVVVLVSGSAQTGQAQCPNGVWEPGEWCGLDAQAVHGVADMNHDCIGPGLSI
jgi:hypothetical protein